jgi:hypothetical protein
MVKLVHTLMETPLTIGVLSFLLVTAPVIGLMIVHRENEKV